jgi:hypothetical protein
MMHLLSSPASESQADLTQQLVLQGIPAELALKLGLPFCSLWEDADLHECTLLKAL